MYICKLCKCKSITFKKYVIHQYLQRNWNGAIFYCLYENCKLHFINYVVFKQHVFRNHSNKTICSKTNVNISNCSYPNCPFYTKNKKQFNSHLYEHLRNKQKLRCPYMNVCNSSKIFVNVSCLKNHLFRKHYERNDSNINELIPDNQNVSHEFQSEHNINKSFYDIDENELLQNSVTDLDIE